MALPQDFLLELKYRNDIESVIAQYITLKRRGSTAVGLCPFHNEKTPSFTVYPEKGNYHCYGCGVGGDVITFVMQIENLEYIEAIKLLADRAGLQMPSDGFDDRLAKLKTRVLEINREAGRFFYSCILEPRGKDALEYLKGRGLSLNTIRHFGLGFAPDSWDALLKHLKSKGFKDEEILIANVSSKSKNGGYFDRYRNRVMFPIIDLRGNVVGFSGRAMPGDEKSAKYINTSDTPVFKKSQNMFALNFAKNVCAERVVLVEGNMDVIALHQAGITNAVAALGTAFTVDQAHLLSRYTKEVVVTLDSDAAGQKATDRVLQILSNVGLSARILRLPDCKDPDEFLKKHGASRFRAIMDGAVSDIEYRLYMAADGVDTTADDGLMIYLKKAVQVLATVDDGIAVDLYAGRLSDKYSVAKNAILSSVGEAKKKNRRTQNKKELSKIISPTYGAGEVNSEKKYRLRAVKAEETVIEILMSHPDFYEPTVEKLSPQNMVTEFSRRLYEAVCNILSENKSFDLALLSGEFSPAEIGYITEIQLRNLSGENPKRVLQDSINVILDENEKLSMANDSTDEQWKNSMKRIIEKKSGH